jgi:hypothetical protein
MYTDWKVCYAGIDNKPAELDTTSSSAVVYVRRNFEEVDSPEGPDGESRKQWKYEEQKIPKEQYEQAQLTASTITLRHESEIIDDYTVSLLEEGVL